MITGHDVLRVLDAMHLADVSPCLEGGWGIDALLGRQTRAHSDLDLCLSRYERELALDALAVLGFDQISTGSAWLLRAADSNGRHVDVRLFDGAPDGVGSEHTDGRGFVVGRPVRCLNSDGQILAHTADPPTEVDIGDLHKLADLARVQLAAPFGRGDRVEYRASTPSDRAAMAIVMRSFTSCGTADTMRDLAGRHFFRYWSGRQADERAWSAVGLRGGVIVGTLAVGPSRTDEPGRATTAVLHGFSAHPSVWSTRVLDPLVHQTVSVANGMGFSDVRVFVPEHHEYCQRFWRNLGWYPDGVRHVISNELAVERFRR